jgi:hypothetical protein
MLVWAFSSVRWDCIVAENLHRKSARRNGAEQGRTGQLRGDIGDDILNFKSAENIHANSVRWSEMVWKKCDACVEILAVLAAVLKTSTEVSEQFWAFQARIQALMWRDWQYCCKFDAAENTHMNISQKCKMVGG